MQSTALRAEIQGQCALWQFGADPGTTNLPLSPLHTRGLAAKPEEGLKKKESLKELRIQGTLNVTSAGGKDK